MLFIVAPSTTAPFPTRSCSFAFCFSSSPPTSTPLTNTSPKNSSPATKTQSKLAMTKWLMLVPMSSQLPSSRTSQKKFMVMTSQIAMTIMNKLLGATPRRRLRMPRLALMMAKGMRIFRTRRAPWEKGLKIGMRR